jgi:hypothetical protein
MRKKGAMATMTTAELRDIIAKTALPEWFADVQATFNYPYIEQPVPLIGVPAIFEYVSQQQSGWEKLGQLPDELNVSKKYFATIQNNIVQFVNENVSTSRVDILMQNWNRIVISSISINNTTFQRQIPYYVPLPYNIPHVGFLLKVFQEMPTYFKGAYCYLLGIDTAIGNKTILYGAILAYEFTLKDNTNITERRDAEKRSISQLRSDFQKYLSESEQHLSKYLHDANTTCTEYVKNIDTLKTEKELLFTTWYEQSVQKITELENAYSEKLKLEEPAKYWDSRAKELKKQGWWASGIAIAFVMLVCIFLGIVLTQTPDFIYASWFGEDKSAAIKWTMIYVTLISFIAFTIRALLKVVFSSFHLARDCEERHTLTYFYLSLLKDAKVNDKDRRLIMQSLFSRAETGLLKDDSSPTMPNDIISRFLSK